MNESYTHKGVTITPTGGGYYDLSHPSFEVERVRGKEVADQRAEQIAAAAVDAPMPPQGDLIVEPVATVTRPVPREFTGVMSESAKAATGVKYTRIILEENSDIPPTGLFVSHNGRPYMIVPGEEVDVPDFVLSVLKDAVMSAPIVDNRTQKVLGYRSRSKFPFRLV